MRHKWGGRNKRKNFFKRCATRRKLCARKEEQRKRKLPNDESRSLEIGFQEQISNRPEQHYSRGRVVSGRGKWRC